MPSIVRTYDRSKVLVGQARPFIQPYDPASPPTLPSNSVALNGSWGSAWTELGATFGGLTFGFERKTEEIMVEEQSTPVQITTDMTEFMFELELSEDSLDTMRYAYGGGTITTTAPASGVVGTRQLAISAELQNFSFGFEGVNEFGFWRRVLVPVVVSVAKAETEYVRAKKQRTYKCEFTSLVEVTQVTVLEMNAEALA